MKAQRIRFGLVLATALIFSACDWMPGKPDPGHRWMPASMEKDFSKLYVQNCQACHSIDGSPALAVSMGNPVYLSWIPREELRRAVAEGVKGTSMPAYGQAAGGLLTGEQIDILVDGILAKKPATVPSGLPPYAGVKGDGKRGGELFSAVYGSSGTAVQGLANPYFLQLVSDSYLRSLFVAGFPEMGLPDYSKARPGKVLSNQEISDLVAWLSALRPNPYPQGGP